MAQRYLKFDIAAFVDSHPTIRWCPHPNCRRAVRLTAPDSPGHAPQPTTVHCGNEHYFCWSATQTDINTVNALYGIFSIHVNFDVNVGCAVLLSLVCLILLASFFLPSHLSFKHVYIAQLYMYYTLYIYMYINMSVLITMQELLWRASRPVLL